MLDDTIVSLLIDHSGSMRGQPILFAAEAAMVASDLLHGLGAKQEVLGFTTLRWKGGASREKWLRAGRPPYPGRLNDLLHIVYCSAGEKLDARDCSTMLRRDLLKENVDGEAIEWAASRLRRRGERHKYLIVLSDGAPVDDSTLYENGDAYMERHLRGVIHGIAQAGDIALAAIGLGHPLGHPVERYYARSIAVAAPEELDGAMLRLIEQLLCPPPPASQDSRIPRDGRAPRALPTRRNRGIDTHDRKSRDANVFSRLPAARRLLFESLTTTQCFSLFFGEALQQRLGVLRGEMHAVYHPLALLIRPRCGEQK